MSERRSGYDRRAPVDPPAGNCRKCGGPVYHRDGKPGEYDHACDPPERVSEPGDGPFVRAGEPVPGTHLRPDGTWCSYLHNGRLCNKCGFYKPKDERVSERAHVGCTCPTAWKPPHDPKCPAHGRVSEASALTKWSDNVLVARVGAAMLDSMNEPAGDSIDLGLALIEYLKRGGFEIRRALEDTKGES